MDVEGDVEIIAAVKPERERRQEGKRGVASFPYFLHVPLLSSFEVPPSPHPCYALISLSCDAYYSLALFLRSHDAS